LLKNKDDVLRFGLPKITLASISLDRSRKIGSYLKANLQTGDTVQPLDNTGGAVNAMLLARARLATPFYQDFHFYHHISNPYITRLRELFIKKLTDIKPRFIIQVDTLKPWLSGYDTTREFKELEVLLGIYYIADFKGDGYIIYKMKTRN